MANYPTSIIIANLVAGSDLSSSQYKAVKLSSDGAVDVAGAGESAIGFLMNVPIAGRMAEIATIGGGAKAIAGGTIAAGDLLKVNADGDLVKTTGYNDHVAIAMESAVDNDIFGVLVVAKGFNEEVSELTVSGAVAAGVKSVELNHASVVVAATIADFANHQGLFVVKDTSASGTAAHTLTLASGTFNGTATVATLNAPNEALVVFVDSEGNGTIVENVGAVALS